MPNRFFHREEEDTVGERRSSGAVSENESAGQIESAHSGPQAMLRTESSTASEHCKRFELRNTQQPTYKIKEEVHLLYYQQHKYD